MADSDHTPPLHLAIIGGGIAGCAAASWAATRGARVSLFNSGLPLGGSCLHVGTFPARLLITAASDYRRGRQPRFDGLPTTPQGIDWTLLRQGRQLASQQIVHTLYTHLNRHPNIEIIDGLARFIDTTTLMAAGRPYHPDRILLTPGSHSLWPAIDGLHDVDAITLAELLDRAHQPRAPLFLEFNAPAMAYAQALARLGSQVTILTEKTALFEEYGSPEASRLILEILGDDGVRVVFGATITHAKSIGAGVRTLGTLDGHPTHWDGDTAVVINHHTPRIDDLGLAQAGVDLTDQGYIVIDESLQTTNPHVFAAGDVIGRGSHAYAEAYDAILAAYNALGASRMAGHQTAVPYAVYTDPQFAGVGWDEPRARAAGFEVDSATCPIAELPAARAMGYDRGFIKLICDRRSNHLVGARIIAPNAAELIMEVSLALRFGLTIDELANMVRPPISLGEGIGRAATTLLGARRRPI